jgi:hypothetical protein
MKNISVVFWQVFLLLGAGGPAPGEPQSVTLPIGTEIAVQTVDRIDSKTANTNRDYAASLDDPVIVDGVTVIPARTNAFLRVTEVKNPKLKRASLSISLVAVTVNGRRVEVNTNKVDSQSGSKAKRTAIGGAAGAGAGAAIGGAVGGGAGAGIGAAIGGVTGAGAGILTGKGVQIAPETRFTYKLTEAIVVNGQEPSPEARLQPAPASVRPPPADAAPTTVAPPPRPSEPPAPPKTPTISGAEPELIGVVYLQNESGALMPLERSWGTARRGDVGQYWEMDGPGSPFRLKSGQSAMFVVHLANGIDPATYALWFLETRNDIRRTKSDPRDVAAPLTLPLNVTKVGDSTYGLMPVTALAAGEYAFSTGSSHNVYCFGVDPP